MTDTEQVDTAEATPRSRRPALLLAAVIVVAALAIAGTAGWLIGHRGHTGTAAVTASSVDAGFARDMSTHHTQAVVMAGYTRDHTSDPAIKLLAYDIETEQYFQLGEMQGWLDAWGLSRSSTLPQMAWMAGHDHLESDGLMPGMATPAQMDRLEKLTGKQLDVFFLQLMIHHHQGGLPMAQYAVQHARMPYVRNLAAKMYQAQSNEIIQMEQLLRQRGAAPLPAPSD